MSVLFDWTGAEGSNIQLPTNESDVYSGQLLLDGCSRDGATRKPCVFLCSPKCAFYLQSEDIFGEVMANFGKFEGCVSVCPLLS